LKKIIATGKGGVGKTTTLSNLSLLYAREGKRVIIFDTDPSMNLALTFGIPYRSVSTITEDKAEISHLLEEHGIEVSGEEILRKHSARTDDGILVVIMGENQHGGGGCLCSAISMMKILIDYTESLGEFDIAIVDSQAGPEILGRGLASSFDLNLILSEPTPKSSDVSVQVKRLADDLEIKDDILVVNKYYEETDVADMAARVGIEPGKAVGIPYDRDVIAADREGRALLDAFPESEAMGCIRTLKTMVDKSIGW
jgi:CO dehydrogenase maturation factor